MSPSGSAVASPSACSFRYDHDAPLMLSTTALCMDRSRIVATTTGSTEVSAHAGGLQMVVMSAGRPRPTRVFTTWKEGRVRTSVDAGIVPTAQHG